MLFYPEDAQVPDRLQTEEYLLRPLRTTDVELDYDALMTSKEMLRRWSQSDWPTDDFTLEDNLRDLKRHEQEHLERKAFTFTMLDLTETECLGCVYINPLEFMLKVFKATAADLATVGGYEAIVGFWVRQARLADDLDRRLLRALIPWLRHDWAFSRVSFLCNDQDARQVNLLTEAGLHLRYALDVPERAAKHLVYG